MRLEEEGHPNDGKLDWATCIWKRIGQNSFDGAVEVALANVAIRSQSVAHQLDRNHERTSDGR